MLILYGGPGGHASLQWLSRRAKRHSSSHHVGVGIKRGTGNKETGNKETGNKEMWKLGNVLVSARAHQTASQYKSQY